MLNVITIRILTLWMILLFPCISIAKEYPTLHYGIEDGLPSNMIYDIYQDPDGFIWIGTDKGVARYNGQKFETFTTADGLSDNECFFFQPDHYGRMWIGTFNGELCYYKDGSFHNSKNTPWLKLPNKASFTKEIVLQCDSTLTVYLRDIPGFYEIKNEKVILITSPHLEDNFQTSHSRHIQKIKQNIYEIFYKNQKLILNIASGQGKTFPYKEFEIKEFFYNRESSLFSTTRNDILDIRLKPINIKGISGLNARYIFKIYQNKTHHIIATSNGALIDSNLVVFPGLDIHTVLQDKNNNLWFGTSRNGIFRISNNSFDQVSLKYPYSKTPIFAGRLMEYIFYATRDRNIYRININTQKTDTIFNHKINPEENRELNSTYWIEGDKIFNLSESKNFKISNIQSPKNYKTHQLKIGEFNGGASKTFVAKNLRFIKTTNIIYYTPNTNFTDTKDSILINAIPHENYRRVNLYASGLDKDNNIWISSSKDIFKVKNYFLEKQKQFDSNTSFREFIFLSNYLIGVTPRNSLLFTKNYEAGKLKFDTVKSNDCIWEKFYPINDSIVLISTNNYFRILTIHSNPNEIKYDIRLLENPFIPYQPEYLFIDSGQAFFFKNGLLNTFPVSYILQKETAPNLKFLFLKTEQNKIFIKDTIRLEYYLARNTKIGFTAISFYQKNLQYEYAINSDGSDNWNITTGEELNLIKIGYGNFIIKVRAKTMSGQYSKPIAFTLIIKKPFWATYWFIGIVSLLIISLIAFIARWSIKRNLSKKENEVRFLRSEYKALNALMNPHFIFNSLNSVQSLVNNNENRTASKYIRIFSDLIRQNMRNISQDLIPLSKELNLVENYLRIEQLRFKDRLSYEINIDENVETDLILIPPLLIQPLVENSIKHGIWPLKSSDGNLKIIIYEKEEILIIEIVDNGVGLKKKTSDTMHESYAMGNIYKRIEQLSQIHQIDIKIDIQEIRDSTTGKAQGVKAVVSIQSKE